MSRAVKDLCEVSQHCVTFRRFVDSSVADCRYELADKAGRSAWPQEWYSSQQVERLAWRQYGDLELPCPGQPELYLAR